MEQFFALVKMEFKNRRKIAKSNLGFLPKFLKAFFQVLFYTLIVAVTVTIFKMIIKLCISNGIANDFLVYFILLFQFIQFVIVLIALVKNLHSTNETKEILTLPVSSVKIFFAKMVYLYLQQLIFSSLVMLPVLITFGVLTSQIATFYISILLCIILIPLVPFCFAAFVSIIATKVIKFLEKRFLLLFIVYALLIALCFYVYIDVLKFLLDVFNSDSYTAYLNLNFIASIQSFASNLYLQVLFKNILTGFLFFKSMFVVITGSLMCIGLLYLFSKKYYFNTLRNSLNYELNFGQKQSKIKTRSIFSVLLRKEITTIFRSTNYSFSFLTMAFTTPIMVFFCNSIVAEIGLEKTGATLFPALTLLILLIFMTLATSFTATSVTREGANFPNTKTMPITFSIQIKSKLALYLLVEIPVIIISCLILLLAGYIGVVDFIVISLSVSAIVFANICSAMKSDIRHPQFNYLTHNEVVQNNSNISSNLSLGLAIGFILGACSIVMVYTVNKLIWYAVIIAFGAIYAYFNYRAMQKNIENDYAQIEY